MAIPPPPPPPSQPPAPPQPEPEPEPDGVEAAGVVEPEGAIELDGDAADGNVAPLDKGAEPAEEAGPVADGAAPADEDAEPAGEADAAAEPESASDAEPAGEPEPSGDAAPVRETAVLPQVAELAPPSTPAPAPAGAFPPPGPGGAPTPYGLPPQGPTPPGAPTAPAPYPQGAPAPSYPQGGPAFPAGPTAPAGYPQQDYYAPGWTAPTAAVAPRRGHTRMLLGIAIGLVSLLIVAGGTAWYLHWTKTRDLGEITGATTATTQQVKTGYCIRDLPADGSVSEVTLVPCGDPHEAQVVGTHVLDDGDWPGQDAVDAEVTEWCEMSRSATSLGFQRVVWAPSEESWGQGDRRGLCIAWYEPGGATGSFADGDVEVP